MPWLFAIGDLRKYARATVQPQPQLESQSQGCKEGGNKVAATEALARILSHRLFRFLIIIIFFFIHSRAPLVNTENNSASFILFFVFFFPVISWFDKNARYAMYAMRVWVWAMSIYKLTEEYERNFHVRIIAIYRAAWICHVSGVSSSRWRCCCDTVLVSVCVCDSHIPCGSLLRTPYVKQLCHAEEDMNDPRNYL